MGGDPSYVSRMAMTATLLVIKRCFADWEAFDARLLYSMSSFDRR
jgi:hypothetical protein